MKHLTVALFLFLPLLAMGCAEERKMYAVESDAWEIVDKGDRIEMTRTTWFESARGDARNGVDTTVTMFPARGNEYWEVDTFTWRGQHVKMEHDNVNRKMRIFVDGHAPVQLAQGPSGLFEYRREHYRSRKSDLRKLGAAVAEDLESRRIEDEAVIATFHAGKDAVGEMPPMARLFFTPIFVDIFTQIQDSMNIGSYNGSTVDSFNHY